MSDEVDEVQKPKTKAVIQIKCRHADDATGVDCNYKSVTSGWDDSLSKRHSHLKIFKEKRKSLKFSEDRNNSDSAENNFRIVPYPAIERFKNLVNIIIQGLKTHCIPFQNTERENCDDKKHNYIRVINYPTELRFRYLVNDIINELKNSCENTEQAKEQDSENSTEKLADQKDYQNLIETLIDAISNIDLCNCLRGKRPCTGNKEKNIFTYPTEFGYRTLFASVRRRVEPKPTINERLLRIQNIIEEARSLSDQKAKSNITTIPTAKMENKRPSALPEQNIMDSTRLENERPLNTSPPTLQQLAATVAAAENIVPLEEKRSVAKMETNVQEEPEIALRIVNNPNFEQTNPTTPFQIADFFESVEPSGPFVMGAPHLQRDFDLRNRCINSFPRTKPTTMERKKFQNFCMPYKTPINTSQPLPLPQNLPIIDVTEKVKRELICNLEHSRMHCPGFISCNCTANIKCAIHAGGEACGSNEANCCTCNGCKTANCFCPLNCGCCVNAPSKICPKPCEPTCPPSNCANNCCTNEVCCKPIHCQPPCNVGCCEQPCSVLNVNCSCGYYNPCTSQCCSPGPVACNNLNNNCYSNCNYYQCCQGDYCNYADTIQIL